MMFLRLVVDRQLPHALFLALNIVWRTTGVPGGLKQGLAVWLMSVLTRFVW